MFLPEMKLFYGVFSGKDRPVSEDVAVMNFDGMVWVDQGKSRGVESKSSFRLVVQGQCLSFGSYRRRLKEEGSVGGVRKCRRKETLPPAKGQSVSNRTMAHLVVDKDHLSPEFF
jgi:hypothetical protein